MFILLRLAAVFGLWLYGRDKSKEPRNQAWARMSWPQKVRLVWRLSQDRRLPLTLRAAVWLPALYLVSPIDLIPDFIPFLGRVDDAVVFGIVADLLLRFVPPAIMNDYAPPPPGRKAA